MRIIKIVALAAAAMLAACTSQKEPAERAVAKIEASLNDVRGDAEKYAGDQLKSTEASVNRPERESRQAGLERSRGGGALRSRPKSTP